MKRLTVGFLVLFLSVFITGPIAQAVSVQDVEFIWTYDNPPTDLDGFHFWQKNDVNGTYEVVGTAPLDVRTYVIEDMNLDDRDNYFAITAFDDQGSESAFVENALGNMNPSPSSVSSFIAKEKK